MTLISLCLPPRLLCCSHAAHTPALRLFAVSRLSRALAPLPGTLPLPDISLRPPARRRPLLFPLHAVAVASTAPVRFWPVLVQAYAADPIGALLAVGACLAAAALAALTVAAIPTILAMRRSVIALEALMKSMQEELPDTAAAVRLSSLEMADAIEEVSGLGSDLTAGLRASARAFTGAEQSVREVGKVVTNIVVPSVKQRIPEARDKMEGALKQRAELGYTEPTLQQMAGATTVAVRRLRAMLGAADVPSLLSMGVQDRGSTSGAKMFADRKKGGLARAVASCPTIHTLTGNTGPPASLPRPIPSKSRGHRTVGAVDDFCRSAGTEAGIAELRDLLTQPSAGGSPPCTFLGVSPPLRSGAANPLGHSSTFTRVAPVACTKNLQFLQQLQCTDGLGPFADRGVFRLSSPKDAMFARPFPQMSDGASGSFEEGRRPQAALPASFPCVSTSGRCSPSQHVSERLSPPEAEVHA